MFEDEDEEEIALRRELLRERKRVHQAAAEEEVRDGTSLIVAFLCGSFHLCVPR